MSGILPGLRSVTGNGTNTAAGLTGRALRVSLYLCVKLRFWKKGSRLPWLLAPCRPPQLPLSWSSSHPRAVARVQSSGISAAGVQQTFAE